ncbi:MAG: hypothetical protein J5374_06860 [Bacteroidales bacterium]|nr:hypothetical protein [Bacteroidales bacterium]
MKKWEDIVKEKMEEPVGTLPESVFDEFHARLDAARSVTAGRSAARHRPLLWALAPAAAAGLAAILLLRKASVTEDGIQIIQQPHVPVAAVADTVKTEEPLQSDILVSQAVTPKETKHSPVHVLEPATTDNTQPTEKTEEVRPAEETSIPETDVVSQPEPSVSAPSPVINNSIATKPIELRVAPAAGIVAGGGLLAAIVSPHIGLSTVSIPILPDGGRYYADSYDTMGKPLGEHSHSYPLFKEGLSVGIPVASRLKITAGLEYSRYRSGLSWRFNTGKLGGTLGEKVQIAQYLGVPLRLDWSLVKNNMLDIYVGGGVVADYCIGATLTDKCSGVAPNVMKLKRDGVYFSLLGASGIQININEHVGFYLEPEVTWTKPPKNPVDVTVYGEALYDYIITGLIPMEIENFRLETYRTVHPFMFTVATGLRFNLGK